MHSIVSIRASYILPHVVKLAVSPNDAVVASRVLLVKYMQMSNCKEYMQGTESGTTVPMSRERLPRINKAAAVIERQLGASAKSD